MRRVHGHARARTFRSVSLPGVATVVRTYTQYSRAVATSVGAGMGVGVGVAVGAGTGTGGCAGAVPAEGGGGASAAEGVSSSRSNAYHELLTEGNSTFTSPWESTRRTRPTVEWSTPSGQSHRGRCGHNKGGKWRTRVSEARARHEAKGVDGRCECEREECRWVAAGVLTSSPGRTCTQTPTLMVESPSHASSSSGAAFHVPTESGKATSTVVTRADGAAASRASVSAPSRSDFSARPASGTPHAARP